MEKKTRKKSKFLIGLVISIVAVTVLIIAVFGINYAMNMIYSNNALEIAEEERQQEQNKKDNEEILYKIKANGKEVYINEYGYITNNIDNSAIELRGITGTNGQERLDEDSLEILSQLLQLRDFLKNFELLDTVNRIDVSDLEDVKIYMDSENQTILIGNFENLTTKFMWVKNIMELETGKQGEIIVKDIDKAYFRESL